MADELDQKEQWDDRDEDQDRYERERYEERSYHDFTSDRSNNYNL